MKYVLWSYPSVLVYRLVGSIYWSRGECSKITQCFTHFYLFYLAPCTKSAQNPFPIRISIVIITVQKYHLILLSESHSLSHRRQQQSPDHSHLSSNHPHLQTLISTPHKYHTLSDTHRPVYGSLPWTLPDSFLPYLWLTYLIVSQNLSSDPPVCVLFSCVSLLHDSWERDSDQFTAVSRRIGLPDKSLTCSSHLTQVNLSVKPLFCYLPVSPCSVCDNYESIMKIFFSVEEKIAAVLIVYVYVDPLNLTPVNAEKKLLSFLIFC